MPGLPGTRCMAATGQEEVLGLDLLVEFYVETMMLSCHTWAAITFMSCEISDDDTLYRHRLGLKFSLLAI